MYSEEEILIIGALMYRRREWDDEMEDWTRTHLSFMFDLYVIITGLDD